MTALRAGYPKAASSNLAGSSVYILFAVSGERGWVVEGGSFWEWDVFLHKKCTHHAPCRLMWGHRVAASLLEVEMCFGDFPFALVGVSSVGLEGNIFGVDADVCGSG
jgi:hypothetical protein